VASVSLLVLTALSVFAVAPSLVHRVKPLPPYVGLLVLGWAWAAANILFNGFAETFYLRYVMLPVAGASIVLAALAQWAISLFDHTHGLGKMRVEPTRAPRYATEFVAIVSSAFIAGITALSLQSSPFVVNYWEWPEASRRENEFFVALDEVLRSAKLGTRIEAPRLPRMPDSPGSNRPRVRIPAILADYSIQAWAELYAPARKIRVASVNLPKISPPGPDEILLMVRDQPATIERFRVRPDTSDQP
jgi:hypothetical protein